MAEAFTAGVDPGGLRSLEEIRILICYMLSSIGEPVPRERIPEIIAGNGMANFFDIAASLDDLIKREHIAESGSGLLTVTATGKEIADTLFRSLPFTLRERSVKAALQLLARGRSQKDTTVSIEPCGHGYTVTCNVQDGDGVILSVSVNTADTLQANTVKENFLQDPALLYRTTLAVLNGQFRQEEQTLRILL